MRILHTADWHIGITAHGTTNAYGMNTRFDELSRSVDWLIDMLREHSPDVLVIAGDIGHRRSLNGTELALIADVIDVCEASGIEIVGIEGNHDQEWNDKRCSSIRALYPSGFWRMPWTQEVFGYDSDAVFVLIPYPNRAAIATAGWSQEQVSDGIAELVAGGVTKAAGRPVIVVAHMSLVGSHYHPEQNPILMTGQDVVVNPSALMQEGVSQVLMGHIHSYQTFVDKRWPITYCGSLMCLDYGEATDYPKGVTLIDVENDEYRRLQNPHSPTFVTISLNLDDDIRLSELFVPVTEANTYVRVRANGQLPNDLKAAIVKGAEQQHIRLTGISEQHVHVMREGATAVAKAVTDEETVLAWAQAQGSGNGDDLVRVMKEVDSCD